MQAGKLESIDGIDCYVTGAPSPRALILGFSDVFPCLMDRKLQVADQLAAAVPNSLVISPDLFDGRPIMTAPTGPLPQLSLLAGLPRTLYRMRHVHNWGKMSLLVDNLVRELKQRYPEARMMCYGYCFGGWLMLKACSGWSMCAGVGFHPSPMVTRFQPGHYWESEEDLVKGVGCPVLLLPAGNDPDTLKEHGVLTKMLPEGSEAHTYCSMSHGYMSRGEQPNIALPMTGTAEELAEVQAEALKRTADFMTAALKRPAVVNVGRKGLVPINDQLAESRAATAIHDELNVVCITLLVVLTLASLCWQTASTQQLLSHCTLLYIIADIVYNLLVPHCQPSKFRLGTILLHHVLTAWLLLHPIVNTEHAELTCLCMVVEINTVLHNANKVLKRPWTELAFQLSWVVLRLLWYPYLVFLFHQRITEWGASVMSFKWLQTVGSMVGLCCLNFVWTAEVAVKMVRKHGETKKE